MRRMWLVLGLMMMGAQLVAGTEEIQLTTYYPAPFGDFEHIRTNTFEPLGALHGPVIAGGEIIPGVTLVDGLRHIDVYRGFRILGEFMEPYLAEGQEALPPVDFALFESDKILFNNGGGIFSKDARNGLLFDRTNNHGIFRAQGDLILQPGYSGDPNNFDFVIQNSSQQSVLVKGDFSVTTPGGQTLMVVSATSQTTQGPTVLMAADVFIQGNLTVSGTITGDISGSTVTVDNIRVKRQLVMESDAERTAREQAIATGGNPNGVQVSDQDASHLIVYGSLWSKSIRSLMSDWFEVRVSNNRAIGRFRRGTGSSGFHALQVPGEAQGRTYGGSPYV